MANEERVELLPEWQGSIYQKWAESYAIKNLWRVSNVIGELDDLMGEAALSYVELRIRYGSTINTHRQFMTLFKMYFSCWIHTLSVKDSHNREGLVKVAKFDYTTKHEGDLVIKLDKASSELKEVLKIFFEAPAEIMETLRRDCSSYSPRQFWNGVLKYCKVSSEKSVTLQKELTDLLS